MQEYANARIRDSCGWVMGAGSAYLMTPFDYFGSAQYKYAQDRRESYLAKVENLKLKTQSHSAKFKSDSALTN